MRLRVFAVALALCTTAAVHAQVASIYVTSANLRTSDVQTGIIGTQEQYTNFWTSGIGGGVTLNFLPLHVVNVGFDFRGSTKPGTTGADTAFGGIRLQINPPVIRLKPYIQASGGYLTTRTTNVTAPANGATFNNQYAAYEVLGGIDYPIVHFVDFRIIEIGGGQAINIFGGSNSAKPSLFTIDSGLVFHF